MKGLKFKQESKFLKILDGKWFYLSLAVSLTMIGATTWVVMNNTINNIVDKNSAIMKNVMFNHSDQQLTKEVNKNVNNIPINRDSKAVTNKNTSSPNNSPSKQSTTKHSTSKNTIDKSENHSIPNEKNLFIMPMGGETINKFSEGDLTKNLTLEDWRTHDGIDIKAKQGSPVKSISDGIVSKVYDDPLWGRCIEINHFDNTTSYYCNLNKNTNVEEGANVEIGQVVGSVGDTAICEVGMEPHLHLGVKENGVWIDPLLIIDQKN